MLFPSEIIPPFFFYFLKLKLETQLIKIENQIFARRSCDVAVTSRSIKTNKMWNLSCVFPTSSFQDGKERRRAHFRFIAQWCFYLATPHIPSGWECHVCRSKTLFCLFEFSRKKKHDANERGCLTIKIRHPIVHVLLCVCFLSSLFEGYFFFSKKGKQKTEGNCAPYGGLERKCTGNPPLRLLVSLIRVFPCFVQWTLWVSRLSHVCVQLVNSQNYMARIMPTASVSVSLI